MFQNSDFVEKLVCMYVNKLNKTFKMAVWMCMLLQVGQLEIYTIYMHNITPTVVCPLYAVHVECRGLKRWTLSLENPGSSKLFLLLYLVPVYLAVWLSTLT